MSHPTHPVHHSDLEDFGGPGVLSKSQAVPCSAELRCPHCAGAGTLPSGPRTVALNKDKFRAPIAPAVRSESFEVIQRLSRFWGEETEETDLSFRISEFAWDTLMLDVLMEVGLGITQGRHLLS